MGVYPIDPHLFLDLFSEIHISKRIYSSTSETLDTPYPTEDQAPYKVSRARLSTMYLITISFALYKFSLIINNSRV